MKRIGSSEPPTLKRKKAQRNTADPMQRNLSESLYVSLRFYGHLKILSFLKMHA